MLLRFQGLQRETMQLSQELEYGRILARTLHNLSERQVTLSQTIGVGVKSPPLPVLQDTEAFRLMKTSGVRVK